jgi:hypothetical protein
VAREKKADALASLLRRAGASPEKPVAGAKAPPASGPEAIFTTTYRVKRRHHRALKAEALERQQEGRGGQDDASAVLRELLDDVLEEWLAKRRR